MGKSFHVIEQKEVLLRNEGACRGRSGGKGGCPACGGAVMAMDFDTQLVILNRFFLPHKIKRRFFCLICSARLLPADRPRRRFIFC
nr:methionyl-tRNA synthetase [Ipomoea batatas]GMD89093.1 methionyl-tRNA synthetase [Ipomoea batatas]GME16616.1 methionyl-tRNA synthetase [Ipomoea batatas]GME16619.1 methionyl-tRNA synthetase [Ipomoea batatas]